MKKTIYLRVAKGGNKGYKVVASSKPIYNTLKGSSYSSKAYPTVLIALDLEIPDSEFESTKILLEAKIKETTPAVEIKQVEIKKTTSG